MKLAFDARVLAHEKPSGVEVYTKNLLHELQKRAEVRVCRPKSRNRYLQQLWEHFWLPWCATGAQLLFCPANIAPLWLTEAVKLVVTLHDVAYLREPKSVSKLFGLYYRFIIPRIIRRADAVVTISEASREEILSFYPEASGKLHVIHSGISEAFLSCPRRPKSETILYVGSLNERKNFTAVIEAFERLKNAGRYRLVMVGDYFGSFEISGHAREALRRAERNPRIEFRSNVSEAELRGLYASSRVLLFPSFYEGFGLPPLEAMACGTAVITSNRSSMPEVCADAALYVDPYSIDDIAEKLSRLLEDEALQAKMVEKGLRHAGAFKWEKRTQEYLHLFESVL